MSSSDSSSLSLSSPAPSSSRPNLSPAFFSFIESKGFPPYSPSPSIRSLYDYPTPTEQNDPSNMYEIIRHAQSLRRSNISDSSLSPTSSSSSPIISPFLLSLRHSPMYSEYRMINQFHSISKTESNVRNDHENDLFLASPIYVYYKPKMYFTFFHYTESLTSFDSITQSSTLPLPPSHSVGSLIFSPLSIGPPGRIHGGASATAADQIAFSHLWMMGLQGFTTDLNVKYTKAMVWGMWYGWEVRGVEIDKWRRGGDQGGKKFKGKISVEIFEIKEYPNDDTLHKGNEDEKSTVVRQDIIGKYKGPICIFCECDVMLFPRNGADGQIIFPILMEKGAIEEKSQKDGVRNKKGTGKGKAKL